MKVKRNIELCLLYGVQRVAACYVMFNVNEPKQSKQVYTKKQTLKKKKKKVQILTDKKIEK